MDRDELLKMLDLKASIKEEVRTPPPTEEEAEPPEDVEWSETALILDMWDLSRGEEILSDNKELSEKGITEEGMADFYGCAFLSDPQLVEWCLDPRRKEYIHTLLNTPECLSLRSSTILNTAASAVAGIQFVEEYVKLLEKDKARKCSGDKKKDEHRAESDLFAAVTAAVTKATEEVGGLLEVMAATGGAGVGPGAKGTNDPRRIAELYRRVRNNPALRAIFDVAGKWRRVAQSKQRTKTIHGYDDMVGVELSGDVGKLLPTELSKLLIPELELDVLRRIVERQCMSRHWQAKEKIGKGPVIIGVDESVSMMGDKITNAKAVALAMAWIARHQKRWCGLIAYSGDTGHRLLTLPPNRWDEVALIEWLEPFIGGGSNIDIPVREMPEFYRRLGAPVGKTDVIFVTDACCDIPEEVKKRFLEWKVQAQARLITLLVGGYSSHGGLEEISDEFHSLQSISVEEAGVSAVLSI